MQELSDQNTAGVDVDPRDQHADGGDREDEAQSHALAGDPASTPGRRSFENLVSAVRRCLDAGLAPPHDDPFRLAPLIWAAEHGPVMARISRPTFPWRPIDALVDEMVTRLMGFS